MNVSTSMCLIFKRKYLVIHSGTESVRASLLNVLKKRRLQLREYILDPTLLFSSLIPCWWGELWDRISVIKISVLFPLTCPLFVQACRDLEEGYENFVKLVFIVSQKRHNTRFFPQGQAIKSGNVIPGIDYPLHNSVCVVCVARSQFHRISTAIWVFSSLASTCTCMKHCQCWCAGTVVDKDVCHPHNYDFFLVSQAGFIVLLRTHITFFQQLSIVLWIRKHCLTLLLWPCAGYISPYSLPCACKWEQTFSWWHSGPNQQFVLHVRALELSFSAFFHCCWVSCNSEWRMACWYIYFYAIFSLIFNSLAVLDDDVICTGLAVAQLQYRWVSLFLRTVYWLKTRLDFSYTSFTWFWLPSGFLNCDCSRASSLCSCLGGKVQEAGRSLARIWYLFFEKRWKWRSKCS